MTATGEGGRRGPKGRRRVGPAATRGQRPCRTPRRRAEAERVPAPRGRRPVLPPPPRGAVGPRTGTLCLRPRPGPGERVALRLAPPGTLRVALSTHLHAGHPGDPVFSNYARRRGRCPAPRETSAHVLPRFPCKKATLSPDPVPPAAPCPRFASATALFSQSCLFKSSGFHLPRPSKGFEQVFAPQTSFITSCRARCPFAAATFGEGRPLLPPGDALFTSG